MPTLEEKLGVCTEISFESQIGVKSEAGYADLLVPISSIFPFWSELYVSSLNQGQ